MNSKNRRFLASQRRETFKPSGQAVLQDERFPEKEWDSLRPVIYQLYIIDDRPFLEVIRSLETDYNILLTYVLFTADTKDGLRADEYRGRPKSKKRQFLRKTTEWGMKRTSNGEMPKPFSSESETVQLMRLLKSTTNIAE